MKNLQKKSPFILGTCGIFLSSLSLTACDNNNLNESIQAISVTDGTEVISDDFSQQNSAWKSYSGSWQFKEGILQQNSVKNSYPVILRKDKSLTDLSISVDFKPISGNIDASGGIIFRAKDEDNYYIVRANALEDNYRLYTFVDGSRHQLASATVAPPTLGKMHRMRVVAIGEHIQIYLNGKLALDYRDSTFKKGYTGLWTKADSVTDFDNFKVIDLRK